MAQLVVRKSAREALNAIVRERRRHVGFVAARALRERLVQGINRLRDYPESGRLLPEFTDLNVRQAIAASYRILYDYSDDTVTILAIVHGRAALPNMGDDPFSPEQPS